MDKFIWGTATSSFQIEGGHDLDGRTASIWDHYTLKTGKIRNDDDGRRGIDHYHMYNEDLKYLQKLGVSAYRFSLSWSRIIPNIDGKVNTKGLDFYDKILDRLEEMNITPFVTLYHWDLPQYLQEIGGWENRKTAEAFQHFTRIVVTHFQNRVNNYITINEPQCIINLGHRTLEHAPGIHFNEKRSVRAIHNLLYAHGLSVKVIREINKLAKVGFAPTATSAIPLTSSKQDLEAARISFFALNYGSFDGVTLYSDPVFLGNYPREYLNYYEEFLPVTYKEDLKIISSPLDYCFQNFYTGYYVRALANGQPLKVAYSKENTRETMPWLYKVPAALYYGPKFLYERYKKPILITENGVAVNDVVSLEKSHDRLVETITIKDSKRIDYYQSYISELLRAKQDGVDIAGYFAWSLFDNFEWAYGFTARFGLVYIDYKDLKRYPKDSFYFYKKLIEEHQDI